MVDRRLSVIFLAITLLVSVLHAERAGKDEETYFENDNIEDEARDVIETIKRFVSPQRKPSIIQPSSGAKLNLLKTTPANGIIPHRTTSSNFDNTFHKKPNKGDGGSSGIGSPPKDKDKANDGCSDTNQCQNGGTCKPFADGTFFCICPRHYYGQICENKFRTTIDATTDHCAKSPCHNGGECVGLRTTFYCRCKSSYYGINCEKRIGKREEIIDESNSSEQDLIAYKRALEEDREDLRRAINDE